MSDPLSSYYRTKEIYVKLPSGGRWYKNPPKLTADGEIGVYPMSVKDELLLKIPDTLYNGEALYEVIQSIAPDIADPYEVVVPDVEVLLLAAKVGQHSGELNIAGTCPSCQKQSQYAIELKNLLARVKELQEHPLEVELENGLQITFKPNSLASVNAGAVKTTESVRLAAAINEGMDPQQAKDIMRDSLEKTTAATLIVLADSISQIKTPDDVTVTDMDSITKWLSNTDAKTMSIIKEHTSTLNTNGVQKEFTFTCTSCEEDFKAPIEYNPAFFFTHNYDNRMT